MNNTDTPKLICHKCGNDNKCCLCSRKMGPPSTQDLQFDTINDIAKHFRDSKYNKRYTLIFAYNGVGKTRLSRAFAEQGFVYKPTDEDNTDSEKTKDSEDTLYFNAYTEDLFFWNNDLEYNTDHKLKFTMESKFFKGLKGSSLEPNIRKYLHRYVEFDFDIDYEDAIITFEKGEEENIKISRGEEHMFMWCFFLAILEMVLDTENNTYNWVKNIYIDDPISSLDDNNVINIACDLMYLLKEKLEGNQKIFISSHHILFYNIIYNERRKNNNAYLLSYEEVEVPIENDKTELIWKYLLKPQSTDTPNFYHMKIIQELKKIQSNDQYKIYSYHFNMLRVILEKTAQFFGKNNFSYCLKHLEDKAIYSRACNLLSHGNHSMFEPEPVSPDNKKLFNEILDYYLQEYHIDKPTQKEIQGN